MKFLSRETGVLHCTLEQILATPVVNFLIPCYHQNSLRFIVKHILFQQYRVWVGLYF